jgi:lysylphosphatidylglycerol synthetase-like protein (DUF2156 family)
LAQRSRKRGKRRRPAATAAARPTTREFTEAYRARTEARNATARARLEPLQPGERPWPLLVAILLTALAGGGQLILYAVGVKVGGKPVPASSLLLFIVLIVCAVGMWRLWYQAVLAFMVLLAIVICLFALLLVEASNPLGVVVGVAVVGGGGYLFWKLVRVLGRLQMPERPSRR